MKREQLKKALKPVIVECVREALYEEGVLSSIISEVVQGLGANVISESPPRRPTPVREAVEPAPPPRPKLNAPGDPLSDADPTDPGIDISGIMSVGGKKWKALSGRN